MRTNETIGYLVITGWCCVFSGACTTNTINTSEKKMKGKLRAVVLEMHTLNDVPGASGLVGYQSDWYITGDNSPFLFRLNAEAELLERVNIYEHEEEVIPKPEKPDFESMELYNDRELFVLGSGSKSPQRDIFVRYDLHTGKKIMYNAACFFEAVRQQDALLGSELNIEAMVIVEEMIYLFNRRRNLIFCFPLEDFISSCCGTGELSDPEVFVVDLPKIDGVEAGFSGACYDQETHRIIVTASVENTDNAYDDGSVLGSFIGILAIDDLSNTTKSHFARLKQDGKGVDWKVESVWMTGRDEHGLELVLVTDSDGQGSGLVRCRLEGGVGMNGK